MKINEHNNYLIKYLTDVIKKDPEVLDGSAFTRLGSLYYKVLSWPIGR